jgi:hypothetical protein
MDSVQVEESATVSDKQKLATCGSGCSRTIIVAYLAFICGNYSFIPWVIERVLTERAISLQIVCDPDTFLFVPYHKGFSE